MEELSESDGPLKAVWVGGVQINELVHTVTEENYMNPTLSSSLRFLSRQVTFWFHDFMIINAL